MTAEEFEQGYADRSGMTVQQLREWGRIVATCHCGESGCKGFKSIGREAYEMDREYGLYPDDVQVLPKR